MTIVERRRAVTGGVDTHLDVHVAAALDGIGGLLGVESFEASAAGNDKLLSWLCSFGLVGRVGVEGTGSYGAGLARWLPASQPAMSSKQARDSPNAEASGEVAPSPAFGKGPTAVRAVLIGVGDAR